LSAQERQALQAGLRAQEAFTLRRCQILLVSADGKTATQIAALFGCATQTVRNTLRAFAAEVAFEQRLTERQLSHEAIRQVLMRLGVGWKRAKTWITSPDPHYARKKNGATA